MLVCVYYILERVTALYIFIICSTHNNPTTFQMRFREIKSFAEDAD